MVTIRYYNKITRHLDFRFKLLFASNYPERAVENFVSVLQNRSRSFYGNFIAYAKDGKIIAREASYRGV